MATLQAKWKCRPESKPKKAIGRPLLGGPIQSLFCAGRREWRCSEWRSIPTIFRQVSLPFRCFLQTRTQAWRVLWQTGKGRGGGGGRVQSLKIIKIVMKISNPHDCGPGCIQPSVQWWWRKRSLAQPEGRNKISAKYCPRHFIQRRGR